VHTAKELSQWSVINDFSSNLQLYDLTIEGCAIVGDWDAARRSRSQVNITTGAQADYRCIQNTRTFDSMLSLVEKKFTDAERSLAHATQAALMRWQSLASGSSWSSSHHNLLHGMQRMVELDESKKVLAEAARMSMEGTTPDFTRVINTWKERLPDRSQSLPEWDSLLRWRIHLFQNVLGMFRSVEDVSQLAALTDIPWTTLKLVHNARKQNFFEVSLYATQLLNSATMEINDAFTQIREQIMYCLSSESSVVSGLNLINTTSLEYFDAGQKAEMFRLKGLCYHRLSLIKEAQESFSQGVQLYGFGKGWLSWAQHSFELFTRRKAGASGAFSPDVTSDALSSIVCILKAVEFDSIPARMLLPRVIWLAQMYDNSDGIVKKYLKTHGSVLPSWIWLPLLPHVLTICEKTGDKMFLTIIEKLCANYPQATLYHLLQSCGEGEAPAESFMKYCRDLVDLCLRRHYELVQRIRWLCESISRSLVPTKAETVLNSLLKLWYELIDDTSKAVDEPLAATDLHLLREVLLLSGSRADATATTNPASMSVPTSASALETSRGHKTVTTEERRLLSLIAQDLGIGLEKNLTLVDTKTKREEEREVKKTETGKRGGDVKESEGDSRTAEMDVEAEVTSKATEVDVGDAVETGTTEEARQPGGDISIRQVIKQLATASVSVISVPIRYRILERVNKITVNAILNTKQSCT
jgi:hypothetical protein